MATDGAPRRPSVKDVAALAHVSAQTVSRVNNGRLNVDSETRARVLQAMETLGYRRNAAGRSLVTGRFGTIGVITSTLSSYGTRRTIEAIADAIDPHEYTITLLPLRLPSSGEVSGAATQLAEQNVDGLIVMVESSVLEEVRSRLPVGMPLVVTDGGPSHRYHSIDSDPVPGIDAAVEHLAALGHREIAHVAGPMVSQASRSRLEALIVASRRHDVAITQVLYGDWSSASGYLIGESLADHSSVTAVVAANDQMALGVIRAMHDKGRRVPESVSVVGFDDMLEVAYTTPRLSTVRQDFTEIGRRAVRALVAGIDGDAPGVRPELVATTFVGRESTAAASAPV